MKALARFAVLCLAAVGSASAAFAVDPPKPYIVRDLSVDVTAGSATEAQTQAWAQARVTAAGRLIDRLTLPEDRAAATSPLETADVARLYKGMQTQSTEKRTSTRYISTLIVPFDDKPVRDYLDAHGVPFVDTQAGLAIVAPVAGAGVNPGDWASVWAGKSDGNVLTPYVASTRPWDHTPAWGEVQPEADAAGALRAVDAEAINQNGQIYVRLTDVRPGTAPTSLGVAGPFPDYARAQTGTVEAMETAWKRATIVRTSGTSDVSAVASFHSLPEWVKIQKGITDSRIISGLKIQSLSTQGADLTFTYAGRPDQLANDLRARGLSIQNAGQGWLIEVASSQ
ncbi:MAG: hypothetical protein GC155_15445 [Alphaproteobacteria bacterium]|nr:hypothetical protein [Alphaproteobacteria bacterium]